MELRETGSLLMVGLLFYGTFKVTTSILLLYANALLHSLHDVIKIQWSMSLLKGWSMHSLESCILGSNVDCMAGSE
jgi:hypothetical protein